jgi:PAS domain S-box-containing protein
MKIEDTSIIQKMVISYECSLAIGNSLNLSKMLQEVIHTIVRKTNAYKGSVWVARDHNQSDIILGAIAGFRLNHKEIKKGVYCIKGIFREIYSKNEVIIKHRKEEDFLKYCIQKTGKEQSILIVPVSNVAIIHIVYANKDIVDESLGNILLGLSKKLGKAIEACFAHENIIIEIDERKKTEALLKDSEEQYRTTLNCMPDAIQVVNADLKIILINKKLKEWNKKLGLSTDVIGKSVFEVFPFLQDRVRDEYKNVFKTGKMLITEENNTINEKKFFTETTKIPVLEHGKVVRVITNIRDITEHKRNEQIQSVLYNIAESVNTTKDLDELFKSIQNYLKEVIDTTNFFIALYDKDVDMISLPYFVDQNDKFTSFPARKTLTKYVINIGKSLLVYEDDIKRLVKKGDVEVIGTISKAWLGVPLKKDKEIIGVIVVQSYSDASIYTEKDAEILEFVSDEIAISISRKKAEEELAQEKERLSVTLGSIGDGVITTDIKGNIVLLNKAAEEITGWSNEESIGKYMHEVFFIMDEVTGKKYKNLVKGVVSKDKIEVLPEHSLLITRDGKEKIISNSIAPIHDRESKTIGIVLVFRDITDKRKMEEELIKTTKLESVGILAGGIAHDFNNILTAIIGSISLAKLNVKPEDKMFGILTEIEKASVQAESLTQQLLTFSKGGAPIKKSMNISNLLKDSVIFSLRGSNVKCEFFITKDLWLVEVDEGQIIQVVNNLIINADQAMPKGGIIKVITENIEVETGHGLPLRKGKYIRVSIYDNGIGISKDMLDKIFDPYFTTKQKGSGLGLSTTYSIIKKHDGYIYVESEIEKGTKFHIYLPASNDKPLRWGIGKKIGDVVYGKGRVLVMDDEEAVRIVVKEMLDYIGYDVKLAKDGEEAIELYRKAKSSGHLFDAVILDLTVPGGMGGGMTLKRLIKIDKDVRAIVSSGYSNYPVMSEFKRYGFKGVIPKPFTIVNLSKVLDQVITCIE